MKNKTGMLILMFASDGSIVPTGGITNVIASMIATARKTPSAPPRTASTKLSVRNCANKRGLRSAERSSDGNFFLTRCAARQKQVCDVDAANQQQKSDCAQQQPKIAARGVQ